MNQRKPAQILVDRWDLAVIFKVHASSIHTWQRHEGLAQVALVEAGGPGKPARYDAAKAIEWYARVKLRPGEQAPTIKQIEQLLTRTATDRGGTTQ